VVAAGNPVQMLLLQPVGQLLQQHLEMQALQSKHKPPRQLLFPQAACGHIFLLLTETFSVIYGQRPTGYRPALARDTVDN
jgi:hypothetical protein